MLGRTACRRERPLQLLRAASISPAPVSSLGHVLTCTSPVLSLRISLMGNPVHSALLPASGVAREGGAGSRALTREAPVATGTVCTLCCNWSVFPLLLGAGSWVSMAFQQALGWLLSRPLLTPAFTLRAQGRVMGCICEEGSFRGLRDSLGESCLNLLHYPPSCSSLCFSCVCRRSF